MNGLITVEHLAEGVWDYDYKGGAQLILAIEPQGRVNDPVKAEIIQTHTAAGDEIPVQDRPVLQTMNLDPTDPRRVEKVGMAAYEWLINLMRNYFDKLEAFSMWEKHWGDLDDALERVRHLHQTITRTPDNLTAREVIELSKCVGMAEKLVEKLDLLEDPE